jgi:hypothetical protein
VDLRSSEACSFDLALAHRAIAVRTAKPFHDSAVNRIQPIQDLIPISPKHFCKFNLPPAALTWIVPGIQNLVGHGPSPANWR